jgi:hypothetical protein
MTTRSTLTLRGDRNQCPGCGQLFNSTTAFEKHRVGPHEDNGRRCLTVNEMHQRGMVQVDGGWWVTKLRVQS